MRQDYKALISLFPTRCGGRESDIHTEYNPNLVFGYLIKNLSNLWKENRYFYDDADNNAIRNADAEIHLPQKFLSPGEAGIIFLRFKGGRENYIGTELLKVGTPFLIREGGRVIGTGKLL